MRVCFVTHFMLEVDPLCLSSNDLLCPFCSTAILPCRRCWPKEDVLGEESWSAVSALCLVSVHPGYRQAHQEVCPLTKRSGYDVTLTTHTHTVQLVHKESKCLLQKGIMAILRKCFLYICDVIYRIKSIDGTKMSNFKIIVNVVSVLVMLWFFCLSSVHGGKGVRYTANEDTPPEKGTSHPQKQSSLDLSLIFRYLCDYMFTKQCPKTQSSSACLRSSSSFPTFSLIALGSLWVSVKIQVSITGFVFAASGVDAVGEVVMNVDILPQPNGEHKIGIKGENTAGLLVVSWTFLPFYVAHLFSFSGGCQWPEMESAGLQALCGSLHYWSSPQWQEKKICHQVKEQQLVSKVHRELPVVSIHSSCQLWMMQIMTKK